MRSHKPILLVEDDKVDAMTVKRALRDIQVTNQLNVAGNGEEALDYLAGKFTEVTQTQDAAEGIMAFMQKREPVFKGE